VSAGQTLDVPRAVAELAREAALGLRLGAAPNPALASHANRRLVALSRTSPALGCLAFRVLTNTVRAAESAATAAPFAASPAADSVRRSLGAGRLVVTGFHPERTRVESRPGGRLSVAVDSIMVTGVRYADHLLVEGLVGADQATSLLLVPAAAITRVVRPEMRGLADADNAVVSLEAELPTDEALFSVREGGRALVEAPYRHGLTFGAVALGALQATLEQLAHLPGPRVADVLGSGVAVALAAEALVKACGAAAGSASATSRAAKVFTTEAAARVVANAVELAGAPAYTVDHPLVRLAADIAGLPFQAPTNHGSRTYLSDRALQLIGAPR
jgi:alkylation response protein AidB-like acyl-CoA dehydrogenase